MGIDVYASWPAMSPEEKEEQLTGFSITAGSAGYLREAYHGGPYSTQVLVPESFEAEEMLEREVAFYCDACEGTGAAPGPRRDKMKEKGWSGVYSGSDDACEECDGKGTLYYSGAEISADTLRERLPSAAFTALVREAKVYNSAKARRVLAELGVEPAMENPNRDDPGWLELEEDGVDGLLGAITGALGEAKKVAEGNGGQTEHEPPPVWDELGEDTLEMMAEHVPMVASLVGFVKLCERKEAEHGRPCRVYASY